MGQRRRHLFLHTLATAFTWKEDKGRSYPRLLAAEAITSMRKIPHCFCFLRKGWPQTHEVTKINRNVIIMVFPNQKNSYLLCWKGDQHSPRKKIEKNFDQIFFFFSYLKNGTLRLPSQFFSKQTNTQTNSVHPEAYPPTPPPTTFLSTSETHTMHFFLYISPQGLGK